MVRLVKKEFVPLAIDGRTRSFDDDEARFLEKADVGGQGRIDVISASGKRVAYPELNAKSYYASLEQASKKWAALPEEERKPGAYQVPKRGALDPRRAAANGPPKGTVIVKVYNRQLTRVRKNEYRHTEPGDYLPALSDAKVMGSNKATALWTQPANDHLWITQAEARAMLPSKPETDQRVEVPPSLCERLFRFHLDPARGLSENDSFTHVKADAGKLWLTVEKASKSEVRLRLDGYAILHNPRRELLSYKSPMIQKYSKSQIPLEYQPRLLGYLSYDPARGALTRFDVLALGDVRGRPNGANLLGERLGEANPLGIAFELVREPKPADLLAPKGARDVTNSRQNTVDLYLGLGKKSKQ